MNGTNKFQIDVVNNRLVFSYTISCANIVGSTINDNTITGCTITGVSITGNTITGGTINGSTVNTTPGNIGGWSIGASVLTSYGDATINILNGSNKAIDYLIVDYLCINRSKANQHFCDISSVYDSSSGVGGVVFSQGLDAKLIAFGHNTNSTTFDLDLVFSDTGFSATSLGTFLSGFTFLRNVDVRASFTVGGNVVATQLYIQNYSYSKSNCDTLFAPMSHTHSIYATTSYVSTVIASLNTSIKAWVSDNFQPKSNILYFFTFCGIMH